MVERPPQNIVFHCSQTRVTMAELVCCWKFFSSSSSLAVSSSSLLLPMEET